MKITTLDCAILGLLLGSPMTGYGIRMIFETTAMGNYSSSPGSIYPAINRLKKLGLVNGGNERGKPISITALGKKEMKHWLTETITLSDVAKNSKILILKFAFMDHLVSRKEKIRFLETFMNLTKAYLHSLETYHEAEGVDMPLHGRLSFEYGIATFKSQLAWTKSTLKTIKNEN